MSFDDGSTEVSLHHTRPALQVQRFRLVVVEGPKGAYESRGSSCSIGSHPSNDLIIDDATVSRFHCEIIVGASGPLVRDLGSRNGTTVDGVSVREAFVRDGSVLRLGNAAVRFELDAASNRIEAATETRFGALVGGSLAMRTVFAQLQRAANTDITLLLEGETGTGKEGAAAAVHAGSARRDGPFVVIDCSALPASLLESELFGHERGAFTGADSVRVGAFEEAHQGTVFLDEIGELPLELQPKLLRVLEQREIRRLGSNQQKAIDVRLIAATNRDLRAEINAGRFRSDLYFRLAVLKVQLPPLRSRPEDLPMLSEHLVAELGVDEAERRALLTPELLATLRGFAWPGNVRELRNYLERARLFREAPGAHVAAPAATAEIDASIPFAEAKAQWVEAFERRYVEALVKLHQGKVTNAARAAGIDRAYLYKLLKRYRVK
ncbi:MAG: sigma 54-interacting transcriptional regulator [Archangiaceae bacterium]|nr:sigma 54-interacting transcriptional regulator [Archangiaceae bacterium]